jgi:hypothetical protein
MAPESVREIFIETSNACVAVLRDPLVAASWDAPSVLAELAVGALVGHLVGGILQVERFLDAEVPDVALITAPEYYAPQLHSTDLSDSRNVAVRQRGSAIGEQGISALIAEVDSSLERLSRRFAEEPRGRAVEATGSSGIRGRVLLLDEYLLVRLVEQTTHTDDLVASIPGLSAELPDIAYVLAIDTLVAAARRRHGDLAVLLALVRRERDGVEALRVL